MALALDGTVRTGINYTASTLALGTGLTYNGVGDIIVVFVATEWTPTGITSAGTVLSVTSTSGLTF